MLRRYGLLATALPPSRRMSVVVRSGRPDLAQQRPGPCRRLVPLVRPFQEGQTPTVSRKTGFMAGVRRAARRGEDRPCPRIGSAAHRCASGARGGAGSPTGWGSMRTSLPSGRSTGVVGRKTPFS